MLCQLSEEFDRTHNIHFCTRVQSGQSSNEGKRKTALSLIIFEITDLLGKKIGYFIRIGMTLLRKMRATPRGNVDDF